MEFKVNIGDPKSGHTANKVLKDDECKPLIGKKIGDTVSGDAFGFAGYEFKVMGGSDVAGFPMRWDVHLAGRRKLLIVEGVGLRPGKRKGVRIRKMVAGNTVYAKTAQVNLMVTKHGKDPIAPPKAEKKEEAAPEAESKEEKPKKAEEHAAAKEEKPVKKSEEPTAEEPKEDKTKKSEESPAEKPKEEKAEKPKKPAKKE